MLIHHMDKGYSFESFGGLVSVSKETLYNWVEKHEAFLYAKRIATQKCRLFWEKSGIDGLYDQIISDGDTKTVLKLNSAVWIYNMKCRFPDTWMEKAEVKNTHAIDSKELDAAKEQIKKLMGLPK